MAILEKIRNYLLDDVSGSVSTEWTVLTALLTAAAVSTLGTFSIGVHVVAHAIETDISVIEAVGATGTTGAIGSETNTNTGILG